MDEKTMEYIFNDIMVTHIMSERMKNVKLHKRVNRLTAGFVVFALVTATYISALITVSSEHTTRINKLTEAIKELKGAKGE